MAVRQQILIDLEAAQGASPFRVTMRKAGDAELPEAQHDLPTDIVKSLGDSAERVGEAENAHRPDPATITARRLGHGLALLDALDGSGRVLSRRLKQARDDGNGCDVVLRLRGGTLAEHPAVAWRCELLADASGHLFARGEIALVVQLGDIVPRQAEDLGGGPLRVLFMAYSPTDTEPVLDFEQEEDEILKTVIDLEKQGRIVLTVAEEGTVAELERRLKSETYDVVHMTGHGLMRPTGPFLAMENDRGERDEVSAERLDGALRRAGKAPRLVVISSCHSANAASGTPSLAARLVGAGVESVLGWVRPVGDRAATLSARDLYERLANGHSPTEAVAFARAERHREAAKDGMRDSTWATLTYLARNGSGFRLDTRKKPDLSLVSRRPEVHKQLGPVGGMRVLETGFVGRRRKLQRLVRILRDGTDQGRAVAGAAIVGLKGQGKSCLAGRAVQRFMQDQDGVGLLVVHGRADPATLHAAFAAQAQRWGDAEAEAILAATSDPVAVRLRKLLMGPWRQRTLVLILDDFEQNLEIQPAGLARVRPDAAELLAALLPVCRETNAKIVVTATAEFEVPQGCEGALVVMELGPLEASTIRKLYVRDEKLAHLAIDQWERLAARLGGNARVLDWARSLFAGRTPEEMRKHLAAAEAALPDWKNRHPDPEEQTRLAELFLRTLARERLLTELDQPTRTFLERARVYDVAVPERAFTGLAADLPLSLPSVLPALGNAGYLERDEFHGERAFRVSPLLAPEFTAQEPERWHLVAATFWDAVCNAPETRDFGAILHAWEHAVSARHLALASKHGRTIDVALNNANALTHNHQLAKRHASVFADDVGSLLWLAYAAMRDGHVAEAAEPARRAAERLLSSDFSRDSEFSTMAEECAHVLQSIGALDLARRLLQTAVPDVDAEPASGDLGLALIYHRLAAILQAQGDLVGARKQLERSLEIKRRVLGTEEHPEVAASLHLLASVLKAQGDLVGARKQLERSLEIQRRVLGTEEHPDIAASLHLLAGVLQAQGDLVGARMQLERSLEIQRRVLGTEEHPNVATSLHSLAGVLRAQGDLGGARMQLERSLEIQRRVLGTEEHPNVAASLHELAGVLQAQGDLTGARKQLERSLEIKRRVLGTEEHPEVAASLHNLAMLELECGNVVIAEEHLRSAIEIRTKVHGGRPHYSTAETRVMLAAVLMRGDRQEEVGPLLIEAYATFRVQVPGHPLLAQLCEVLPQELRDAIDRQLSEMGKAQGGIAESAAENTEE